MRQRLIYGILKVYKGIFTKKHIGNVQILIVEMNKTFWGLHVLGKLKDEHICQMITSGPVQYISEFINYWEENENWVQLEELFVIIPKENQEKLKVMLKKKGKYIKSNLQINFNNEHSNGRVRIYNIKGDLKLAETDTIQNGVEAKMIAMKKQSIIKPFFKKMKR